MSRRSIPAAHTVRAALIFAACVAIFRVKKPSELYGWRPPGLPVCRVQRRHRGTHAAAPPPAADRALRLICCCEPSPGPATPMDDTEPGEHRHPTRSHPGPFTSPRSRSRPLLSDSLTMGARRRAGPAMAELLSARALHASTSAMPSPHNATLHTEPQPVERCQDAFVHRRPGCCSRCVAHILSVVSAEVVVTFLVCVTPSTMGLKIGLPAKGDHHASARVSVGVSSISTQWRGSGAALGGGWPSGGACLASPGKRGRCRSSRRGAGGRHPPR
jgi:hypothetical protein